MTVYVDNFRAPATVERIRGRWSHLTADTPQELHDFAQKIGLDPKWFQGRCKYGSCPAVDGVCAHFHYDVTDTKRTWAITHGAQSIDIRELGAITSARRPQFRQVSSSDQCGRCGQQFDPADQAFDGSARYRITVFCRSCVDRCHESSDFDHTCVICADPGNRAGAR